MASIYCGSLTGIEGKERLPLASHERRLAHLPHKGYPRHSQAGPIREIAHKAIRGYRPKPCSNHSGTVTTCAKDNLVHKKHHPPTARLQVRNKSVIL